MRLKITMETEKAAIELRTAVYHGDVSFIARRGRTVWAKVPGLKVTPLNRRVAVCLTPMVDDTAPDRLVVYAESVEVVRP